MEKRQIITTERRHAYPYEPAGTEHEEPFEAMVKSLEKCHQREGGSGFTDGIEQHSMPRELVVVEWLNIEQG